ncbi:unnamed protein product [Rhizoctonia solani]|uniref:BSD domain n=1 Tax=Rhizoctonia solani TaxID=456999 RepID=A0A8H3CJR8_9AGAM|nr:BSD domain-containing protein [Rhizoctonia solani]KAF8678259.1 BSD domain [Rhizoctonia solani]QRW21654.1 BSD domain-containing protein [Rhizoctonia solani]CAE6483707.1 unnamed protein product [Rhizoctonia solani]
MANLPELFDIADQIQEDERRASLDQPSSSRSVNAQPQQTLGEEVNEVIGQLGRFWGGFQKQSQAAFQTARKDFGSVVQAARKEASWLGNNATTQRDGPAGSGEASNSATASSTEPPAPISIDTKGKEKEVEDDTATIKSSSPTTDTTPGASATTGTFFSRLQANLPPQFAPAAITATLQSQLSTAQAQADALRTSLATNIQRIQQEGNMPISFAQAEKLAGEYVHRSEELLKGAGAFLKDAVHVIPAEGVDNTRGVVWDGSDIWMMPSPMAPGTPTPEASASGRPALTHAEALLKRLKSDPEVLRVDPASSSAKERYEKYITGIDISDTQWTSRIREVIADTSEDSDSLLSTKEKLVPEAVSEDEFWKRYFFRVQQINEDEEKRKIILKAPTQPEDDFSWEDDEKPNSPINNDESNSTQPPTNPTTDLPPTHPSTSTTTLKTSTNDLAPPSPVPAAESATTPTATGPNSRSASQILIAHSGVSTSNTSPRESESSFDVVSASSSVAGMNADVADKKRSPDEKTKTDQKDDSDDSDWE